MIPNNIRLEVLRKIQRAAGGILRPADIVAHARNPESPLHGEFDWDDSEAAEKWRLEQAREIIRVTVVHEERKEMTTRAFVSLARDRVDDGGYRYVPSLVRTPKGRQEVLEEALAELRIFARKYRHISALTGIFVEIEKATAEAL